MGSPELFYSATTGAFTGAVVRGLFQGVESDTTQRGKTLGRITFASLVVVLTKKSIQNPVTVVLNGPVRSDVALHLLRVDLFKTAHIVVNFGVPLTTFDKDLPLHKDDAAQSFPSSSNLRVHPIQVVTDDGVLTPVLIRELVLF